MKLKIDESKDRYEEKGFRFKETEREILESLNVTVFRTSVRNESKIGGTLTRLRSWSMLVFARRGVR